MSIEITKSSAGPGSRGGHVIGHTKSGKPVYASKDGANTGIHEAHQYVTHNQSTVKDPGTHNANAARDAYPKFTAKDHEDAAAVHEGKRNHVLSEAHRLAGHKMRMERMTEISSKPKSKKSSGPKSPRESSERMASPSESEHASRSPGGDKRMATAAEAGKFAIKNPPSSPWDTSKSLKMDKKTVARLYKAMTTGDMPGSSFGQSADGIDLLRQMISSYENANFGNAQPVEMTMVSDGDKDLDDADAKNKQEASSIASESDKVDTRGNAPHLPVENKVVAAPVVAQGDEQVAKSQAAVPAVPMMISQDQLSTHSALLSYFAGCKAPEVAYHSGKVF